MGWTPILLLGPQVAKGAWCIDTLQLQTISLSAFGLGWGGLYLDFIDLRTEKDCKLMRALDLGDILYPQLSGIYFRGVPWNNPPPGDHTHSPGLYIPVSPLRPQKKKIKTPNWYTMVYHGILVYHGIHVMSQPFCDSYPIRGASSLSLYIPGFLHCGLHPHPRPTHTETQFLRPTRSGSPNHSLYIPVFGIAAWTASTFSFLIRNYHKKVLNALSAHRKPNFIWS